MTDSEPRNRSGNSSDWTSVVIYGLIGAGLVLIGRRAKPGMLSNIAVTIGSSLIVKSVSQSAIAGLLTGGS